MTPEKMIDALLVVPYVEGAGELTGADCWGIIELWHRYVLNIELSDRAKHPAGHGGLQSGFDVAEMWRDLDEPEDNCLVVMRSHGFLAGHVGIYYQGSVLHSDVGHGCVFQPFKHRTIMTRVTKFAIHNTL